MESVSLCPSRKEFEFLSANRGFWCNITRQIFICDGFDDHIAKQWATNGNYASMHAMQVILLGREG